MRWKILAIGKPKLNFVAEGMARYADRLRPFASVQLCFLKGKGGESESAILRERSNGTFRIVLDESGELVTSRALAQKVGRWERANVRIASLLVGGAQGHDPSLRQCADWVWSLSPLTLQHELALLVALEQLYRAHAINAGLPYHRD
jgi:23S rRNA (pseudouridine1915-N3)-methyltransferase